MSHFVRSSKYRNVYAEARKSENNHLGVKANNGTPEGHNLGGNRKFVGVSWSGGGGSLAVINNEQEGRLGTNVPMLKGHRGPILDWSFNPFDDHQVVTASDDCTLKFWEIPEGGLKEDVTEALVSLEGHQKRVNVVVSHKVASGIVTSSSHDKTVKIWDLAAASATQTIEVPDVSLSLSYNLQGNSLVTSCKDKTTRIIDPRAGSIGLEWQPYDGSKPAKSVWAGRKDKIICTGFTRQSERVIKLYDPRNTSEAVKELAVDVGAGLLMPMYCEDTSVLFIAGKGDTSVKFFELAPDGSDMFFLNQAAATKPQKGACLLPKMAGDVMKHEIARICRLTDSAVEVMPLHVPRKSTDFQEDIFPDTFSSEAALTSEQWLGGTDAEPKTMSVKAALEGAGLETQTPRKAFKSVLQLQKELDEKDKRIAELEAELAALKA